jgi:hypothetical protein
MIILREGHVDFHIFPSRSAYQLLLKAGNEGAGAQLQGIALSSAALKLLLAQETGEVNDHGVAQCGGSLHLHQLSVLGLLLLHESVYFLLGDLGGDSRTLHALILTQGHSKFLMIHKG